MNTFESGQKVYCGDARMDTCGPCLDEKRVYTVREFIPPERCGHDHYGWDVNGGRMELEEPPHGYFYGRRFDAKKQDLVLRSNVNR